MCVRRGGAGKGARFGSVSGELRETVGPLSFTAQVVGEPDAVFLPMTSDSAVRALVGRRYLVTKGLRVLAWVSNRVGWVGQRV